MKKFTNGIIGLSMGITAYLIYVFMSYSAGITLNHFEKYNTTLVILIAAPLTVAIACVIFALTSGKKFFRAAGIFSFSVSSTLKSMLCGVALNMLTVSLVEKIPFPESWISANEESVARATEGSTWQVILASYIIAPLVEELIFRGITYTMCKKGWGIVIAGAVSAAFFGAVHGNILQGIYAGVAGAFFVVIYECTGSFWCTVAAHGSYNLGNVLTHTVSSYVASEGVIIAGSILTALGLFLILYPKISELKAKKIQ